MNDLELELKQFTVTTAYHRLYPKIVLTDGALFLANKAECFWLMDVYASHLLTGIDGENEPFTVLKLVKEDFAANVTIEDGNDNALATQHIEFTDFALTSITLFGCWCGEYWVVMLPSEY
jgi:hypothetical protein